MYVASVDHDASSAGGKIGEPIVVVVSQVRLGTPPEQKIEDAVCGFLHRACQYLAVKNVIFFAISP